MSCFVVSLEKAIPITDSFPLDMTLSPQNMANEEPMSGKSVEQNHQLPRPPQPVSVLGVISVPWMRREVSAGDRRLL